MLHIAEVRRHLVNVVQLWGLAIALVEDPVVFVERLGPREVCLAVEALRVGLEGRVVGVPGIYDAVRLL